MNSKKTLYQVLEVPANASVQEIRTAYQQKLQKLQADESRLSREDFDFRLKLLNMALETLSDPISRRSYDEKLMSRMSRPGVGAVALRADPDTLTRRADALALRADALALRADAISIRTDVSPFAADDHPQPLAARVMLGLKSSLKKVAIAIGTLAAIVMLIQAVLLIFAVRRADNAATAAAKAEEKILIQEYYQAHGVRPANAAEARLLEQENRRQENEARAAERERQRAEEQARRFQEETRYTAESVSSNLRYAEEMARREEAHQKARLEEEERRREAAERERLDREKAKWRAVLSR